jgi:hypothetical protein
MRSNALIAVAVTGMLSLPVALATGCSSQRTAPASVPSARNDLGQTVPNRLSAGTFRSWDDDGDGFLSRNESRGALSTYFDDLDKDRDGKLSPSELGIDPQAIGQR